MESFEDIFMSGGHTNSLGRSAEVLTNVLSDQPKIDELFSCIYSQDAWVRMRAIDTFEKIIKVNPTWAEPYTDKLISELTQKSQPSIQWHLAQLFTEIQLNVDQKEKVMLWLTDLLSSPDIDWIVSANAMIALQFFYLQNDINTQDFTTLLSIQSHHTSKSVRKKALSIMDSIIH